MKSVPRILNVFALAALMAAPVAAQKSDLKRALPASTLWFVTLPDIDGSVGEFADMPLAKIWREQEVQVFLGDLIKKGKAQWQEGVAQLAKQVEKSQSPLSVDEILSLRVHGVTIALTGLAVEASPEMGQVLPDLGFMVHADFGSSAPVWRKAIEFGLRMLEKRAGERVVRKDGKIGDVATVELVPQLPGLKMSLNLGFRGTGLLIATRAAEFKASLEAWASGKEVLTALPSYKATAKHLATQGAELESFLQMGPLLDTVMRLVATVAEATKDQMPMPLDVAGVDRALDAIGLRSIVAIGSTVTYSGSKAVWHDYTLCPAPGRKGFTATGYGDLSTDFLRWVPKDSTSVSGSKFNAIALYDGILGAIKAYSPDIAKMAERRLAMIEKHIGFKIRDDLAASLGDEYVSWSMPMAATMQLPEMGFVIKMRDPEKFLKVAKQLAAMSDGRVEISDIERQTQKMHVVKINADFASPQITSMFSPTFAFKKGHMALGLSTSNVKRVLDRLDREDDPKGDIRSNSELGGLLSNLPKEGLSAMSLTDWKAFAEGVYQMIATVLAFVPANNPDLPIDLSQLPESTSLTKHFFGAISWTQADGEGFSRFSTSPFGPELLVGFAALTGAIGVGVAQNWNDIMRQFGMAARAPAARVRNAATQSRPTTTDR